MKKHRPLPLSLRRNPPGFVICALSLCAVASFAGCGGSTKTKADDSQNAPRVAVVQAARNTLASNLEIASEFQPYQEIEVYAKVSGYIQKLDINWGTRVRRGQLLAVLEIPELEQQLVLDEAAVKRSEQEVFRTQEELTRSRSAYSVAHLTYSRLADVQKKRPELVAQQELDVAQGKDQEAGATVSAAQDALAGSQQELLASKAALEKDRAMFSYARITAPFDGVVTRMDAFTGSLLPAGTSSSKGDQSLCRLSQNDLLRLVIPLPERAVPDVSLGEVVAISTGDKKFEGKIVRFSDQIDTQTRTMHTEIDVPNPKYELVPGMYATVQIPLHTIANALTVPVQAVQTTDDTHGVALVVGRDNRIEKRDLGLGLESATDVQVLSGLNEGDTVVVGEQSQYKPGMRVMPKIVSSQSE
jgi:RND family efflux transporter MFP subunit